MPNLHLIEPAPSAAWKPFCDARPICELRAGVWLIRERWEAIADEPASGIHAGEHLHHFVEDSVPPVSAPGEIAGPALIGLSTFAPAGVTPELPDQPVRLVNDDATVGWSVPAGETWTPEAGTQWDTVELEGFALHGAFDLVTATEHLLVADVADFTGTGGDGLPDGCTIIGDPEDVVVLGAWVEPGVTFDVREGVVVVEQHASVKGGTRFEGPVFVGPGSEILGGPIRWSVFGPRCKARGEITGSVFTGYANKGHEGFIGHSVIAPWVNLGAGTTTSNLKNTYGDIRLTVDGERIETGRQFLGSLIGDHAKTAIGTMLGTGTVIGAGANVFGDGRPPAHVPPFAWGLNGKTTERDGFLRTAGRVMPRRKVEVTDAVKAMLGSIYDHAVGS